MNFKKNYLIYILLNLLYCIIVIIINMYMSNMYNHNNDYRFHVFTNKIYIFKKKRKYFEVGTKYCHKKTILN